MTGPIFGGNDIAISDKCN